MDGQQISHPFDDLVSVATPEEIMTLQREARNIYVDPLIKQYIVSLVETTRNHKEIALGASPRASLGLQRTSQALAMIQGREYVLPDDVKGLAVAVMAHRLVLTASARMQGIDARRVVQQITEDVAVPGAGTAGTDGRFSK